MGAFLILDQLACHSFDMWLPIFVIFGTEEFCAAVQAR